MLQTLAITLLPDFEALFRNLRAYTWWQVVVELVLIGVVLYWVVSFLRGTRGARLLKGAGVLMITLYVLVRLVADRFELERIAFLYGGFLQFAFIAIIVVFQPELRRALMRIGETRLFRSKTAQVNALVETLVTSSAYLAKRHIGALIAIEREVGLGGIADSGTRLNADLSADMLNTIFWPNSPLHDLGVIISQGRIAYAGVQFPLAESGDLDRALGSRHRAAVGMSLESDAVVLVVSEETGDISLAEDGHLVRRLTADQLRNLLTEMMGGASAEAPPTTPARSSAAPQPDQKAEAN